MSESKSPLRVHAAQLAATPPGRAVPEVRRELAYGNSWRTVVLILLVILSLKALRLVQLALAVRQEVTALQALVPRRDGLGPAAVISGPLRAAIAAAGHDILALRAEAGAFFWFSPLLGWIPVYGPDVAASGPLLDAAGNLMRAADEALIGLTPLMQSSLGDARGRAHPTPAEVVDYLARARPHLRVAHWAANQAALARSKIPLEQLSPRTRIVVERIDTFLPLARGGLAIASVAPELLGAGPSGKTYLIVLQNEDELRATGGFISAVGTVTVQKGKLSSLTLEDSYAVDDLSITYPPAPEPLRQYMSAPITLLRDSNWSPDFPTSAALAASLYTATRPGAIDGVIAIDQTAVRFVLGATGPVSFEGALEPVGADNVVNFMRTAWSVTPGEGVSYDWWLHRKDFVKNMAAAMVDTFGVQASWIDLGQAAMKALNERHVLVWLKDPRTAAALAELGWDGAIGPGPQGGDYLMVVETNLGFNKVNAAVQTQLTYSVDLSSLAKPSAALTVADYNPASGQLPCRHEPAYGSGLYADLIARCYWNYLRVYTPQGTALLGATPHTVPGDWLLSGEPALAKVRILAGENGTQSFETLLVVPFGQTLTTEFRYSLAPGAVTTWLGKPTYQLHLQKQPGTQAIPLQLRVKLPDGATIIGATPEGVLEGNTWSLGVGLAEDTDVRLTFHAP